MTKDIVWHWEDEDEYITTPKTPEKFDKDIVWYCAKDDLIVSVTEVYEGAVIVYGIEKTKKSISMKTVYVPRGWIDENLEPIGKL